MTRIISTLVFLVKYFSRFFDVGLIFPAVVVMVVVLYVLIVIIS